MQKTPFNTLLAEACRNKNNRLCLGLDLDPDRMAPGSDTSLKGMKAFAQDVINATLDICPVYKLNLAFYERFGSKGYQLMEELVDYIGGRAVTIADGKRGDIGNTSRQYARALFETIGFDAVTVSPYMGRDSILPFIENPEKGVFVLCLTSNPGANDLQTLTSDQRSIYLHIAELVNELNGKDNLGLVVGATNPEFMSELRTSSQGLSWLIPGIGAQGGDLETSIQVGNDGGTGIINVSRGILYAGDGSLKAVETAARDYTEQIRKLL